MSDFDPYPTSRATPLATKFWLGVGFIGTQNRESVYYPAQDHLHPKFSISSDFGHFVFKKLANGKFYTLQKDTEIPTISGGGVPCGFQK